MVKASRVTVLVFRPQAPPPARVSAILDGALAGSGLACLEPAALGADRRAWEEALRIFERTGEAACLLTIGGAGPGASDFVPEATARLLRRPIPGLPEAFREARGPGYPAAAMFRGVAGLTGDGRLVVNLPGEEDWLEASAAFLGKVIAHAVAKAAGDPRDCGRPD